MAAFCIQAGGRKRFDQGPGVCAWCGQKRDVTFDYRAPNQLDYKLDQPTHKFCNLQCYWDYWDVPKRKR